MPRKGENIYKRKDGRWEGRYIKSKSSTGKVSYGYVYAKTYREVKAKLIGKAAMPTVSTATSEVNLDVIPNSTDLFEPLAMEWFNSVTNQVKESTSNKYWNLLKSYIIPVLGNKPLCDITHEFLETQCNLFLTTCGVNQKGLSPKTVSDILSLIRNILQFAAQKGKILSCDARSIHIKRQINETRVLSRTEQEKLCQYLYSEPTGCNMGILLCLFTGLRIGELCALRWEDISFSDHTIRVHQTLQRVQDRSNHEQKTRIIITTPKSACSIRIIPIPDTLLVLLKSYQTSNTGYVLTNNDQKFLEPRTMQNHFKKALKKSFVDPVNYHSLRHTFATRCVELGFDVKSLSEILGHSSITITMNRYVHPSMELKKENMQRLSELLAVK